MRLRQDPGQADVPRDLRWLTLCVAAAMTVNVLEHLWSVALGLRFGEATHLPGRGAQFTVPQTLRWLTDVAMLLTYPFLAVTLAWIYRASRNAHLLQPGLKVSPLGAVLWYLVPIISFFRPYQAMRETWRASRPPGASTSEWLLIAWWAAFLACGFAFGWKRITHEPGAEVNLRILGDVLAIAASVLFAMIAWRVAEMQRAKVAGA